MADCLTISPRPKDLKGPESYSQSASDLDMVISSSTRTISPRPKDWKGPESYSQSASDLDMVISSSTR